MKVIRHPKKKKLKGSVVALGTFDGVHRGHQKIIKNTVRFAKKLKRASLVITFDPHPQELIVPERGLKLLTTLEEREELFCDLGVDGVVVIKFRPWLQRLSYEDFVRKYLVEKLGVHRVFVGFDYAFGKGRAGDVSHLKKLGKKYGFSVSVISPVSALKKTIKSRDIRKLLSRGRFSKALKLLGNPYRITGRVVKGSGRGKKLGYPTANLKVPKNKLLPSYGVYIGRANGPSTSLGASKKCVVNIGSRPTFGASNVVVEAHLLNFKGNLKGRKIKLYLYKKLRNELHFADVELLKKQIHKDISIARKFVI